MSKTTTTAYINGHVYTFNEKDSATSAFAVEANRLLAVGDTGYVQERAGPQAEIIDLAGATVVPGFIDAHVHLIDYGLKLQMSANLVGSNSLRDVQDRLRAHLKKLNGSPDSWLLGYGFDHELFETHAFPTREDLDEVSADRPIIISRICGHAVIGNSRVFDLCNKDLSARVRQTGLATGDDIDLLYEAVPDATDSEIDRAILLAGEEAASLGLTTVHCLLRNSRQLDRLYAMHAEKRLPIRFYAQIPYSQLDDASAGGLHTGSGDEWLTIGAAKIFTDGSLGARTAALYHDYTDEPGNKGLLFVEQDELADMIKHAQSIGFQTATHAIGDKAVEITVNAIESACMKGPNKLRHRVEHASQMTERALAKMAHCGIPVAVQPQFVLTDFWTCQRVGSERYKWCYPFKTMIENGIPVAMSSDCYVEKLDPYELIYRAWVRDDNSKSESLTPRQTIRAYTMGSAYAGSQEHDRGSLAEGKLADVVIFREPLFDLSPEEILGIRPETVLIGGQRAANTNR